MGTFSTICRILVVIVNVIFLIVGLVLFAFGMFLRFGTEYVNDTTDSVENSIQTSLASAGFGTVDVNLDVSDILFALALCFIFLGLLVVAVTMLGCCGSCYKIRCLLVLYVVVNGILLIGLIVGISLLYGSSTTIKKTIKTSLKDGIQSSYTGINGTNAVSMAWNIIMQEVECCGVDSYADFTGAENWLIDYTHKTPPVTLKTPLSCCHTLPTGDDFSCAGSAATSAENYMETGCVDEIWDLIIGSTITIVVLAFVCGLQILVLVLAIVILCATRNEYKNKVRPSDKYKGKRRRRGGHRHGERRHHVI